MTTSTMTRDSSVGVLLREWRQRRRISQLDLAIDADISTRHLSFVETGRAKPSREMVLRLGERLDVPLRERNHLLLAAGYAPVYRQTTLDDPELAAPMAAVRDLLHAHDPFPAAVVDREWNLVHANAGIHTLIEGVAPHLLSAPTNVLRLTLHPDGMGSRIVNFGEWRAHLLSRLRREVAATADEGLRELLSELREYPGGEETDLPESSAVFIPLRMRAKDEDTELSFFSTVSTFGTALDITLAELTIEAFFPADQVTADYLRRM